MRMLLRGLVAAATLCAPITGMAESIRLSPKDRALTRLIVAADTSCERPLIVTGTQKGTLGGERGRCEGDVEVLTLRDKPIHLRFVDEGQVDGLSCETLYKAVPPGGPALYNVVIAGPHTFETGKVCVSGARVILYGGMRARCLRIRDVGEAPGRVHRRTCR